MISIRQIVKDALPTARQMLAGAGGVCEIHTCEGEVPTTLGPTPLDEFLGMYADYGPPGDYEDRKVFREARPHRPYIAIIHRDGTLLIEIARREARP